MTDPLRQGDVLEATDPLASKWQRHLLVITADCDFAYDKHQGRVTCIPLLTAPEYLLELQLPRIRERYVTRTIGALREVLTPEHGGNISNDRLREWPCETEPTDILATLRLTGKDAEVAKAALLSIRLMNREVGTLDEAVEAVVEAQLAAPNPKKRANVIREIAASLKSPYAHPPGDALFLSAIAPKELAGYFAYLRHLEQIREADIAIGPTRRTVSYHRISRLQDRYIYALAQRFALVFMSIGLPKEYEETRDLHSEVFEESYK
ncbi:hypothetical protein [Amycolatopsis kentuckyensis]|uniref:hypothetical protein n=1 Tax=Amycolatopsis kentuckyensis TaxID=218823 RepID=UPI0035663C5E